MTGELDGFSVTIYAKEWDETNDGQVVSEIDWHAVTIGRDNQIKNKDSRFGVAGYKALFGSIAGASAGGTSGFRQRVQQTMVDQFNTSLFTKAVIRAGRGPRFEGQTASGRGDALPANAQMSPISQNSCILPNVRTSVKSSVR